MDAVSREVRIPGEYRFGCFERSRTMPVAWRASGFNERGDRVIERGNFAVQPEGTDVLGEFRPASKTVLSRDYELRIRELEGGTADRIRRLLLKAWMIVLDSLDGAGRRCDVSVKQILGLFFVLFEIRLIG